MSDKSPRSFTCRDTLWEKFEQMAGELECSIDYLINDAMKQYARQRGYGGTRTASNRPSGAPSTPPEPDSPTAIPPPPPAAAPRAPLLAAPPPPAPPPAMRRGAAPPLPATKRPTARPPGRSMVPAPAPLMAPPPPAMRAPAAPAAVSRAPGPPPLAPSRRPPPPPASQVQSLFCYYNGDRTPVARERFIIGRGKQSTDLTIRDPNVSRQHAMVEFMNGQYFMVDMGSTNGVEFGGQRVGRRAINEGDIFMVCDHTLRFSYR